MIGPFAFEGDLCLTYEFLRWQQPFSFPIRRRFWSARLMSFWNCPISTSNFPPFVSFEDMSQIFLLRVEGLPPRPSFIYPHKCSSAPLFLLSLSELKRAE